MNKFCSTCQKYIPEIEGKIVRKYNSSGKITGKFMCTRCIEKCSTMKRGNR